MISLNQWMIDCTLSLLKNNPLFQTVTKKSWHYLVMTCLPCGTAERIVLTPQLNTFMQICQLLYVSMACHSNKYSGEIYM
jgi:RNase P subunit RPR2